MGGKTAESRRFRHSRKLRRSGEVAIVEELASCDIHEHRFILLGTETGFEPTGNMAMWQCGLDRVPSGDDWPRVAVRTRHSPLPFGATRHAALSGSFLFLISGRD